jgi:hypothetical protein
LVRSGLRLFNLQVKSYSYQNQSRYTFINKIEGTLAGNIINNDKENKKYNGDRIPLQGTCAWKREIKRKHGKDLTCKKSKHS